MQRHKVSLRRLTSAATALARWMQFQTYLPTKNDLDPMVGIALAGDDNRIRAVANSLRLP